LEEYTIPAPIGINTMPITKKDNITGRGVRMGCHAFNLCCLNAVFPGRLDWEELSLEDMIEAPRQRGRRREKDEGRMGKE